MMQTTGIPSGQRNWRGETVLYKKPTKVLQLTTSNPLSVSKAGHAEFASEAGCWLRTVRSKESLGRTYHRRRTHQEDENHREGSNGKTPCKQVMPEIVSMQPHHSGVSLSPIDMTC